jgi:hypothetical protein
MHRNVIGREDNCEKLQLEKPVPTGTGARYLSNMNQVRYSFVSAYFPYFEIIKVSVRDHVAVCVCVCMYPPYRC